MTAELLELFEALARKIAKEEIAEQQFNSIASQDSDSSMHQVSIPFPVDSIQAPVPLKRPHPFRIIVLFEEGAVSAVKVRHGAFVLNDSDGTHLFIGTEGSDDESDYTLIMVPEGVTTGDKSIWAILDKSSTPYTSSISTIKPSDSIDTYAVCVGKVTSAGAIQQYVFGHIPVFGSENTTVRGEKKLYKVIELRAYDPDGGTLRAPGDEQSGDDLFRTWDYPRQR